MKCTSELFGLVKYERLPCQNDRYILQISTPSNNENKYYKVRLFMHKIIIIKYFLKIIIILKICWEKTPGVSHSIVLCVCFLLLFWGVFWVGFFVGFYLFIFLLVIIIIIVVILLFFIIIILLLLLLSFLPSHEWTDNWADRSGGPV